MWVQCILCDRYIEISDETSVVKRFKKRPDYAFLCSRCGGGLGDLELNVTSPGVLPQELAGEGRLDQPAFAAWSEPAKPRQKSRRFSEGAATGAAAAAAATDTPLRPTRDEGRRYRDDQRSSAQVGEGERASLPAHDAQASAPGGPLPERGEPSGEGRHRRRRGRHGRGSGPGQNGENGQHGQNGQHGNAPSPGGGSGGQQPRENRDGRHGNGGRRGRHSQPRSGGQPSAGQGGSDQQGGAAGS